MKKNSSPKILGPFSLAMIAIVAVVDLRGVTMMASYGVSSIFLYSMAALLFLIPSGLVCAELATNWREAGGMYIWVQKAFGNRVGFLAIWLEWLNNVIGFPASLTFITVSLAYLYHPAVAENKAIMLVATLLVLWGTTFFTFLGIKESSRFNIIGAVMGTFLPGIVIIFLCVAWIYLGMPLQIDMSLSHLVPSSHSSNPGFFAALILGFSGMQIVAFHSSNVSRPGRSYPKAIFLAIAIIFAVLVFDSLAVAVVVPQNQMNLVSGLIDAFDRFFIAFHMPWASPVIVFLIIISALATLNAWFLGPARGLAVAAQKGYLPKIFSYKNKNEVPVNILLLQGLIGTLFATLFLSMPDITSGFWVLLNLSSQAALIVYGLIFAAAIKLRYVTPHPVECAYKIPGKNWRMWVIAGTGFLTCLGALVMSVIPPDIVKSADVWNYEMILLVSNLFFLGIPLLIFYYSPHEQKLHETEGA